MDANQVHATQYLTADKLGSTRMVTDGNGNVTGGRDRDLRFRIWLGKPAIPAGAVGCLSVSSPFARPSPVNWLAGIHDCTFEACSGFTRVTACKVAARAKADSCPEASTRPVARPDRSVTGSIDSQEEQGDQSTEAEACGPRSPDHADGLSKTQAFRGHLA